MDINNFYYVFLAASVVSIFIMFFIKNMENKIKCIYITVGFFIFGLFGLVSNVIFEALLIQKLFYIFELILSVFITWFLTKILVINISSYMLLSSYVKNHESIEYIGLTAKCETNITKDGGVILLNNKKRLFAKTYDKSIDKEARVLITDYDGDGDLYIVDHYPI